MPQPFPLPIPSRPVRAMLRHSSRHPPPPSAFVHRGIRRHTARCPMRAFGRVTVAEAGLTAALHARATSLCLGLVAIRAGTMTGGTMSAAALGSARASAPLCTPRRSWSCPQV
eukprot:scaffold13708_cov116-Isochrysis_galbana.AAC.3